MLDAISKNVYNPYATKFAEFVVPLFLDAYRQVDQQTKAKMEEMLVTWRTGSPSGKEVFGFVSQLTLERNVWGGDDATSSTNSPRKAQHAQPVTKSQVLAELEVALAQKERVAALNPSDTNIKNQATALYQVCHLLLSKLDCLTKSFDYSFVNLLSGVSHRKSCHKFCSNFGQRPRTPPPQRRHKA